VALGDTMPAGSALRLHAVPERLLPAVPGVREVSADTSRSGDTPAEDVVRQVTHDTGMIDDLKQSAAIAPRTLGHGRPAAV
jgi:hypothetical protein